MPDAVTISPTPLETPIPAETDKPEEWYRDRYWSGLESLDAYHVSDRPRLIATAILKCSFGLKSQPRRYAIIPSYEYIEFLTGIPRAKAHGLVGELVTSRILQKEECVYYRNNRPRKGMKFAFMHPGDDHIWSVKHRFRSLEAAMKASIAYREIARITTSDGGQLVFTASGFAEEPGLFDALAEVTHDSAMDSLPFGATGPQMGLPLPPKKGGLQSFAGRDREETVPEKGTVNHISDLYAPLREQLNTFKCPTVPKKGTNREKIELVKRALAASSENELIQLLRELMDNASHPIPCPCGRGMCKHGGFWRTAFRHHPRFVREGLQELQLRMTNTDLPIRNLGATLRDRYNRAVGKTFTRKPS